MRKSVHCLTAALLAACGLFGLPLRAEVRIDAVSGSPFGVARIEIRDDVEGLPPPEEFAVFEREGRALYPAVDTGPVRRLLRDLLNIRRPLQFKAYFLFQGEGPLEIRLFSPDAEPIAVMPREDR